MSIVEALARCISFNLVAQPHSTLHVMYLRDHLAYMLRYLDAICREILVQLRYDAPTPNGHV